MTHHLTRLHHKLCQTLTSGSMQRLSKCGHQDMTNGSPLSLLHVKRLTHAGSSCCHACRMSIMTVQTSRLWLKRL
jgi:hypothetical protein